MIKEVNAANEVNSLEDFKHLHKTKLERENKFQNLIRLNIKYDRRAKKKRQDSDELSEAKKNHERIKESEVEKCSQKNHRLLFEANEYKLKIFRNTGSTLKAKFVDKV